LVERLRCEAAALPVILVSGAMPTNELKQHPGLQLAAMLAKPFTGEELLRTVEEVLHNPASAREQIEPRPAWRSQLAAHG
jgi:DNA-binding response OmpR family regulator